MVADSTGVVNLVPQADSIRGFMNKAGLKY